MSSSEERVSDADRDRVVEELAAHTVAGRLSADELAARSDEVRSAHDHAALERAKRELPGVATPPVPTRFADRVPLRGHVAAYLVVSALLVGLWAGTRDTDRRPTDEGFGLFWPFWIMLAWGLIVVAHALYSLRRPAFDRPARGERR